MECICHCLPLTVTPKGHASHGWLRFAAGHAHGSGGNSGFLCIEEERRPQGSPCVDIVFGYFEQCYLRHGGGDGLINHRDIETKPVIIHLGPFDISQCQIFFLPSRFLFWVNCLLTRMNWRSSNPRSDWKHPEYIWFERDFLGKN